MNRLVLSFQNDFVPDRTVVTDSPCSDNGDNLGVIGNGN